MAFFVAYIPNLVVIKIITSSFDTPCRLLPYLRSSIFVQWSLVPIVTWFAFFIRFFNSSSLTRPTISKVCKELTLRVLTLMYDF